MIEKMPPSTSIPSDNGSEIIEMAWKKTNAIC
jgi:hypothetical protein